MNSGRIGKTWLLPLFVFSGLLIIGIGSAAAADELTATRDISSQTVEVGDTFTVSVVLTANQIVYAPVLDEDLPSGWTVTEVDSDGATFKNTTNEWLWWAGSVSAGTTKTVIYNVTVPSTTINRSYAITGDVSANNVTATAVGGESTVTVGTELEYDPYDIDQDGEISMGELLNAIGDWKAGNYGMTDLLTTIARWKAGSY